MTPPTPSEEAWETANQRQLLAAIAVVRARLERHARGECASVLECGPAPAGPLFQEAGDPEADATTEADAAPSALQRLCDGFKLSEFERDLLLLCAGCELDAQFPALCAAAQGDPRQTHATFSLALAVLPNPHWSALTPDATLRRWRLIDVGSGGHLTTSPLRIDERVLHFLAGVRGIDPRLRGLLDVAAVPDQLPPSHLERAHQLAAVWQQAREAGSFPAVHLAAREHGPAVALAAAAAASVGLRLFVLRAADLPPGAAEREHLARLWEREAVLDDAALLVEIEPAASPEILAAATAFLDSTEGPVVVVTEELLRLRARPLARLEVPFPEPAEQRLLWREALGPAADALNGHVNLVSTHFRLSPAGIRHAGAELQRRHSGQGTINLGEFLWDACRAQTRPRLEGLACRIEARATWDDLVVPTPQRQTLLTIVAHVRQRARVHEDWGFSARSDRGLGISALFSGGSGTGKTMAAEVLANELRLDLYRIDLSALVSKYIGETEKNLRRVFDAAEAGGAILLFDEADAIFGRRSEVRDSHDRYANIEVGYLLTRIESFHGLVILTTNQPQALDPAFARRIRFAVQFPFPDAAQRVEIWRRAFPAATPTETLQIEKLARLHLAGGHIRNLALNAAFLAADHGESVGMRHLLAAAQTEFARLEKPLSAADTAGWVQPRPA